jgi:hypothetical protein
MNPLPIQRPRPPLVIGAKGPATLKVVARHADVWNTFVGFDLQEDEFYERTAEPTRILEDRCADIGRDPASIVRSLLLFPPLDPWSSPPAFGDLVGRHSELASLSSLSIHLSPSRRRPSR